MSTPFEIKGKRGALTLYFEDDDLAIDVTEYGSNPGAIRTQYAEMFVTHEQIGELIQWLEKARHALNDRKTRRAREAAERLAGAGVRPLDPSALVAPALRHDADLMESVALFYLNEVTDARTPEIPF